MNSLYPSTPILSPKFFSFRFHDFSLQSGINSLQIISDIVQYIWEMLLTFVCDASISTSFRKYSSRYFMVPDSVTTMFEGVNVSGRQSCDSINSIALMIGSNVLIIYSGYNKLIVVNQLGEGFDFKQWVRELAQCSIQNPIFKWADISGILFWQTCWVPASPTAIQRCCNEMIFGWDR